MGENTYKFARSEKWSDDLDFMYMVVKSRLECENNSSTISVITPSLAIALSRANKLCQDIMNEQYVKYTPMSVYDSILRFDFDDSVRDDGPWNDYGDLMLDMEYEVLWQLGFDDNGYTTKYVSVIEVEIKEDKNDSNETDPRVIIIPRGL